MSSRSFAMRAVASDLAGLSVLGSTLVTLASVLVGLAGSVFVKLAALVFVIFPPLVSTGFIVAHFLVFGGVRGTFMDDLMVSVIRANLVLLLLVNDARMELLSFGYYSPFFERVISI